MKKNILKNENVQFAKGAGFDLIAIAISHSSQYDCGRE